MDNDRLLEMVSELSAELVEVKKTLADRERTITNQNTVLGNIDGVLNTAKAPDMHVVNRVEWLLTEKVRATTEARNAGEE